MDLKIPQYIRDLVKGRHRVVYRREELEKGYITSGHSAKALGTSTLAQPTCMLVRAGEKDYIVLKDPELERIRKVRGRPVSRLLSPEAYGFARGAVHPYPGKEFDDIVDGVVVQRKLLDVPELFFLMHLEETPEGQEAHYAFFDTERAMEGLRRRHKIVEVTEL